MACPGLFGGHGGTLCHRLGWVKAVGVPRAVHALRPLGLWAGGCVCPRGWWAGGHGVSPGMLGQALLWCIPGTPGIAVPKVWGRPWDIRVLGLCRVVCPGQGSPRDSGLGKGRQFLGVVAVMAILVLARLSLAMAALGCSNTQICKSFLTSTSTAQHSVLAFSLGASIQLTPSKKCVHMAILQKSACVVGWAFRAPRTGYPKGPMFHGELRDAGAEGRSCTSSLCFLSVGLLFEKSRDTQALWRSPGVMLLLVFSY